MEKVKLWIKALRVPFFTATLIPVVLGSVLAWHDTSLFSWPFFFLLIVAALFMHAATNLSNDFFDHLSGNDEANKNPTDFSGGSRVIQEKLIPAKHILIVAIGFFALGATIGLYLNFLLPGNTVLMIGILGLFLGFFYTAPPFRLGYNGIGEIATGIGFGPLIVLAAYFVQAQSLSLTALFASVPLGILIALVLYINQFPDYDADKAVRKNTLVVLLGKRSAVSLYVLSLLSAYTLVIVSVIYGLMPNLILISFLTLPIAFIAVKTLIKNYDKIDELLPANKATIGLHLAFGLLMIAGYVLDSVF